MREYWILDTKRRTIHVYDFENEKERIYDFKDRVRMQVLEGLKIDFSEFALTHS